MDNVLVREVIRAVLGPELMSLDGGQEPQQLGKSHSALKRTL